MKNLWGTTLFIAFALMCVAVYVNYEPISASLRDFARDWWQVDEMAEVDKPAPVELEESAIASSITSKIVEINKDLPRSIDGNIRFDEVVYDQVLVLIYRYTLLRDDADDLDPAQFDKSWVEKFGKPACKSETASALFSSGVGILHSFRDKNGVPFRRYQLTDRLCSEEPGGDAFFSLGLRVPGSRLFDNDNIELDRILAEASDSESVLAQRLEALMAERKRREQIGRQHAAEMARLRTEAAKREQLILTGVFATLSVCGVAVVALAFIARRRIKTAIANSWRRQRKEFRAVAYAGMCWPIGVLIFVLLAEPYRNGGLSDMEESDFLHMIGVMALPPAFVAFVIYGYRRLVD